jgi:hypothetical protein
MSPTQGSLRVRSSAAPAHGAKCTCLATRECRALHAPGSRRPASHRKRHRILGTFLLRLGGRRLSATENAVRPTREGCVAVRVAVLRSPEACRSHDVGRRPPFQLLTFNVRRQVWTLRSRWGTGGSRRDGSYCRGIRHRRRPKNRGRRCSRCCCVSRWRCRDRLPLLRNPACSMWCRLPWQRECHSRDLSQVYQWRAIDPRVELVRRRDARQHRVARPCR